MRNFTVLIFILLSSFAMASGGHNGGHKNIETMDQDDQHSAMGDHAHSKWLSAPAEYQELMQDYDWSQQQAVEMGKGLYDENCAACHGDLGQGNGPAAASLQHAPANLTKHFHKPGTKGDGYLLWRVSEGGQAEPFKSQNSMMPSFKSLLSLEERQAVLSYLHQVFHLGNSELTASNEQVMADSHAHENHQGLDHEQHQKQFHNEEGHQMVDHNHEEHGQSMTANEQNHNSMGTEDKSL